MVTQNTLRTRNWKQAFEDNFKYAAFVDLDKWLKQIKLPFHFTRAHLFLRYYLISVSCSREWAITRKISLPLQFFSSQRTNPHKNSFIMFNLKDESQRRIRVFYDYLFNVQLVKLLYIWCSYLCPKDESSKNE